MIFALSLAAVIVPITSPVEASLPGKPFTQTQCEGYSDSVVRLYTAGLGREPEQDGFDFWINEYTSGRWSFQAMAAFFVTSPEFSASYGALDQDGFIRQIYRNVLGREGEAGGVAYWNSQMTAGVSRATVLMRFAESPENIAGTGTTQPTLGEFNEGRTGSWRCGPDLSAALLVLSDFPAGWNASATSRTEHDGANDTCQTLFWFPSESNSAFFFAGDQSQVLVQALYPYATESGAAGYLNHARDGIVSCASFADTDGVSVTMQTLNLPQFGDESLAVALTRSSPNGTSSTSYLVVVRVGTALNGIQLGGAAASSNQLAAYADLATQRLTTLLNS